jgi:Winged helix DNA-binding domain
MSSRTGGGAATLGPVRTLTTRELNRAVLARQLLLERAPITPAQAVERVAGLQTQYAPSGYVGLWSRTAGFRRDALTGALLHGRIVQAWMMRATIHMVSAADHAPLTAAVREARRDWWRRAARPPADLNMPAVADAVRGYLADRPLRQVEIQRRLAADGFPKIAWQGTQLWLDLVRVPPAGTWETPRAHVYGLADLPPVDEAAGRDLLVTRYLAAFGPASAKDLGLFCGWTVTASRAVLERLELRRFRDEAGGELVDVPGAPLPPPDRPAPVRFLGQWDAVLLTHARRGQILPERFRPLVFATSMPQSVPTFLVDGQVAGTWRHRDGAVHWEAFEELTPTAAREVDEEAGRLTAWYAG